MLEVSHAHPQLRPGAHTGVWCATKLATDAGGWRQINRAGHPMMWPIFWPNDTDFSDPSNTRHPSEDVNAAAKYIGGQIAAAVAANMGAEAFADRARRELLAAGDAVRKHTPEARTELTAQETSIARLAQDGQTNTEIGAQLFLSARTVEWHLGNVFTKLGITSRRELRRALAHRG